MTAPTTSAGGRRDPFAVPSGTTLRFGLLILSATVLVMDYAARSFGPAHKGVQQRFHRYQACWERANGQARGLPSGEAIDKVCGPDPRLVEPWVPLAAVVTFWLLVLAIYWVLPAWRIRRRRYDPLGAELAHVRDRLETLRAEAGVRVPVTWYVQPLDAKVSALAFGRLRRRCVVLSGGILALRTRRPDAFDAIVLHELAHVRNHDIDISFIAIITARLTLPLLILTVPSGLWWELVYGTGGAGSLAEGAANSLQILGLVVVMPLARRAVLRSRELYADARAGQWTRSPAALRALFEGSAAPGGKSTATGRRGGLLRVHPTAERRLAMLDDNAMLFRSGFGEMFAAGFVIGTLFTNVSNTAVFNWTFGVRADVLSDYLGLGITGVLLGAVIVVLALRFNEGAAGADPRLLRAPAWGLGCGLALGAGPLNSGNTFALATVGHVGVGYLPWAVLLGGAAYGVLRWSAGTAWSWRRALRRSRWRTGAWIALGTALVVILVCALRWLMELMIAQSLMSTLLPPGAPELACFVLGTVTDGIVHSWALLVAASLAALLALLGRALDPATAATTRRELRRTLGSGVRWGLSLTAVLLVVTFGAGFLVALVATAFALLVLALRVGGRPRAGGLPFAHAVVAVALAGLLALAGYETVFTLLTCPSGRCLPLPWTSLVAFWPMGVVLVLAVAAWVPLARKGRSAATVVPREVRRPGLASLVLGVASCPTTLFVLWPLGGALAVAAVICGLATRDRIPQGEGGRNLSRAGFRWGVTGVGLTLLVAVALHA